MPAKVALNDKTFGGSILINPGGPGGSGVDMADTGPQLQKLFDKPGEIHYEIVGFDPRGVGVTTPSAYCFNQDFHRRLFHLREDSSGGHWNTNKNSMGYKLALNRAFGQHCRYIEAQGAEIMAYASTANVARDMVEIIDRIHEFHQSQTNNHDNKRTLSSPQPEHDGTIVDDGTMPRLKFLGGSYGSILGNTFASLYPGRVDRMILDGIADADDWVAEEVSLSSFGE